MEKNIEKYVGWGKEVLQMEATAIGSGSESLGESFGLAVNHFVENTGRVIVSGLGKSGHIARKIAATFASTGTPSFFLHPSEALHGDSGIFRKEDILLAIANSGETNEILKVVDFAKKQDIFCVGMSSKKSSTLAKISNLHLSVVVASEADPFDIVPTCSSTLALALGDALAVATMRAKNFGIQDFANLHPGGTLGAKLKPALDLVYKSEDLFCEPDIKLTEIIAKMQKTNAGIIGIVAENKLLGCFTDGDLRRALIEHKNNVFQIDIQLLMKKQPVFLYSDQDIWQGQQMMEKQAITALFVLERESKNPIGVLKLHDVLEFNKLKVSKNR